MRVVVGMRGRRAPALAARLARRARRLLRGLRLADAELSILLVSDRVMQDLNRRWRGRDAATDVLSFPQQEGRAAAPDGVLGDVVISVDTARRQATARRVRLGHEAEPPEEPSRVPREPRRQRGSPPSAHRRGDRHRALTGPRGRTR